MDPRNSAQDARPAKRIGDLAKWAKTAVPALLLLSLLVGTSALAERSAYIYSEGGRLLPDYCKYTRDGQDEPFIAHAGYAALFGKDIFGDMHHHCRALYKLNELVRNWRDEEFKQVKLKDIIDDFDYVLVRSDNLFVLRPEILTKKGQALLLMGQDMEALAQFEQAIALRKDYVPAYIMLSNYFLRRDDVEAARGILQTGLIHSPESGILKRKVASLPTAE